MQAAVLEAYGEPLEIQSVERPEPDEDGIVVSTEACGVCRSDWHAWQGEWEWIGAKVPTGQVLGHEPAGVVEAVGEDVTNVDVGDRVAIPFNLSDGTCGCCRNGFSNICENLVPLGFTPTAPGAFAEAFHVPDADQNAVLLPDDVSFEEMASLGCRFVTAFHGLSHRANVRGGDWVAVHGCGGVGLSAIHIADALGANVVAVDIDDEKLDVARDLGAAETVNAEAVDSVPRAVIKTVGRQMDVSIDALGIEETCRNSVNSLARRGTHLQIGLTSDAEQGNVSLPNDAIVMKEIDFLGSYGMQPPRYDEILTMIGQGKLDPGKIVSERISLDEVSDTLAAMSDYETIGISVINDFQ